MSEPMENNHIPGVRKKVASDHIAEVSKKEMSEPLDLEKAKEIFNSEFDPMGPVAIDLDRLYGKIAEALASERRRLIEKFRPVSNNFKILFETVVMVKGEASVILEFLNLFDEIEKENGQ